MKRIYKRPLLDFYEVIPKQKILLELVLSDILDVESGQDADIDMGED